MNFISVFGTMQSQYKDGLGDSVLRVQRLRGYNERLNDVLYAPKLLASDKDNVVVFFGGDVQVSLSEISFFKSVIDDSIQRNM